MNKESLMAMGLTEEQAAKVMEGLNGSFVTKARFNEVNTELTKAKATITERDGQLETLKKSGADATALQAQITQLQADNAQKDKDHAAEMRKMRVDHAVDSALSDAKAINTVFSVGDGSYTPEQRLNSLIDFLINGRVGEIYRYRKMVW